MSSSNRKQLAKVINNKLENEDLKVVARQIVGYLTTTKTKNDLSSLMREVMALRAQNGVLELKLTTANELDAEKKAIVAKLIKEKFPKYDKYLINYVVNPNIVSGIKIETADKELDYTVCSKINKFKALANSVGAAR
jgi:F0F1-type ATP synthase delta subunit